MRLQRIEQLDLRDPLVIQREERAERERVAVAHGWWTDWDSIKWHWPL